MKLLLPSSNSLPTDAELECSWGDGTTFQTLVGKTKISKYENHDLVILRGPSSCCADPVLGICI